MLPPSEPLLLSPRPSPSPSARPTTTIDETTTTFTLVYTPDRTLSAPTEIILPGRVYPGGAVSVDCGGCGSYYV